MSEISTKIYAFSFLLVIMLTVFACENRIHDEQTCNSQLSQNSLNEFNRIFEDFSLNGQEYHFLSGYWIESPQFNDRFARSFDTVGVVLFTLKTSDFDSLIIGVHRNGCFASVVYKLEKYLYVNQSVIFPSDFTFLNEEKIPIKFNCINSDNSRLRETNFEAHMIGEWCLDSINSIRMNYTPEFELNKFAIERDCVILNDTAKFEYFHSGYDFQIIGTNYSFFKVLTNDKFMILINIINQSYEEYYFSKKSCEE